MTRSRLQLDQREDGDSIQDALLEMTGGRSVPRVFINGKLQTSCHFDCYRFECPGMKVEMGS